MRRGGRRFAPTTACDLRSHASSRSMMEIDDHDVTCTALDDSPWRRLFDGSHADALAVVIDQFDDLTAWTAALTCTLVRDAVYKQFPQRITMWSAGRKRFQCNRVHACRSPALMAWALQSEDFCVTTSLCVAAAASCAAATRILESDCILLIASADCCFCTAKVCFSCLALLRDATSFVSSVSIWWWAWFS